MILKKKQSPPAPNLIFKWSELLIFILFFFKENIPFFGQTSDCMGLFMHSNLLQRGQNKENEVGSHEVACERTPPPSRPKRNPNLNHKATLCLCSQSAAMHGLNVHQASSSGSSISGCCSLPSPASYCIDSEPLETVAVYTIPALPPALPPTLPPRHTHLFTGHTSKALNEAPVSVCVFPPTVPTT